MTNIEQRLDRMERSLAALAGPPPPTWYRTREASEVTKLSQRTVQTRINEWIAQGDPLVCRKRGIHKDKIVTMTKGAM